jgi:hypothetical protein
VRPQDPEGLSDDVEDEAHAAELRYWIIIRGARPFGSGLRTALRTSNTQTADLRPLTFPPSRWDGITERSRLRSEVRSLTPAFRFSFRIHCELVIL